MKFIGADPYILFDKKSKMFYCYATSNCSSNKTFLIYKSKDLFHWEFVDYALKLDDDKNWGKDWFWAPECYCNEKTGRYFLFYSARVKDEYLKEYFDDENYEEGCKIGVATSTSPEGPFVNISDRPFDYMPFDDSKRDILPHLVNPMDGHITKEDFEKCSQGFYPSLIDANVLFDGEKTYLYYSRCCYRNWTWDKKLNKFIEESNIMCVEIDRDWFDDPEGKTMPHILDSYKVSVNGKRRDKFIQVISYQEDPQNWENGHVNDFIDCNGLKKDRRWSEGSTTFVREINGKKRYFITYSCNNFENELYGVGLAIGDSPLGPFKKSDLNPIISQIPSKRLYSTGHGSWINYKDKNYYIFHGRESKEDERTLYIGEMEFNEEEVKLVDFKKFSE